MPENKISRRKVIENSLKLSLAALSGFAFSKSPIQYEFVKSEAKKKLPFRISLNTSTISAYKLEVNKQISMVSHAGFDGIELWMHDIMAYLEKGGTTASLKKKLQESNLHLENIIGFAAWCSDDPSEQKKAIVQLRKEMFITAEMGGSYIAAPVLGIKTLDCSKFNEYAERYNAILDLTKETTVIPILEIWGTGALSKLADCSQIVIATGNSKATMLLDFYHLYRGGSDYNTLDIINGKRLPVIHMNDFPAAPTREKLTDADRILPGDGICPFNEILPKLYESGFRGGLSVELFNKNYWATMDAETILRKSFEKTVEVIERALVNVL